MFTGEKSWATYQFCMNEEERYPGVARYVSISQRGVMLHLLPFPQKARKIPFESIFIVAMTCGTLLLEPPTIWLLSWRYGFGRKKDLLLYNFA